MKIAFLFLFATISFSLEGQLELDSTFFFTSNTEGNIGATFEVRNLTDEEVGFYWYVLLNEYIPEGWTYDVFDANISGFTPFTSDYHTPCEPATLNIIDPLDTVGYYSLRINPDSNPGMDTVQFCLTEECGNLDTTIDCITIYINITDATFVSETQTQARPILYPNPSHTDFSLINGGQVERIEIYNSQGKHLTSSQPQPSGRYDVSQLSLGTYHVMLYGRQNAIISIEQVVVE